MSGEIETEQPRKAMQPHRRKAKSAGQRAIAAAVLLSALFAAGPAAADDPAAAWAALRAGGVVALLRHASAPGTGDPPQFRLDDCSTQRNLSAGGRAEARALGERLRAERVPVVQVLSSQWCRCLETARLLDAGPVEPFAPLNSFFARRQDGAAQTEAVRASIAGAPAEGVVIMVTHQVNITALTGVFPQSGELLVLRPAGTAPPEVIGIIPPP